MDRKNFRRNLKYIVPFLTVLLALIVWIVSADITGTTGKYSLNDSPDMAAVFSDAMKKDKALVFEGENDGLSYTWTYDSGNVVSAEDTSLIIKPYDRFSASVRKSLGASDILMFRYSSKINLNGTPRLTIKKTGFTENAYLFKFANGRLRYVSSLTVNPDDVTFEVKNTDGIYVLADGVNGKKLEKARKSTVRLKAKNSKEREQAEKATRNAKDKKTYAAKKKDDEKRKKSSSGKHSAKRKKHVKGPIKKSNGKPINLDDQVVDESSTLSCTLYVECRMALDNMDRLSEDKRSAVPKSGVIFGPRTVTFSEGENVYDVLSREMRNAGIPFDSDGYTKYSSAYVRGINNLYEFDCGKSSGWIYLVNGKMPNFGCSRYVLSGGDEVHWKYSVR